MKSIKRYQTEIDYNGGKMYVILPFNSKVISAKVLNYTKLIFFALVDPKEEKTVAKEVLWLGEDGKVSKAEEEKIGFYRYMGTFEGEGHSRVMERLVYHVWLEQE